MQSKRALTEEVLRRSALMPVGKLKRAACLFEDELGCNWLFVRTVSLPVLRQPSHPPPLRLCLHVTADGVARSSSRVAGPSAALLQSVSGPSHHGSAGLVV